MNDAPGALVRRCPICKFPTAETYKPFCSKRCANVDLGRWLTGAYAVAGGNADAGEDGDGEGAVEPPQAGQKGPPRA